MLAAKTFFIAAVTVYELIHGNIKHIDELNENTKTRVLPFVLNIHNRVERAAHKLRKVFLRPAFFLTGVFYRQSETMKIKSIFIMFHNYSDLIALSHLPVR